MALHSLNFLNAETNAEKNQRNYKCLILNQTDASEFYVAAFTGQKATIHQLATMLSTSNNVLFPGHTTC